MDLNISILDRVVIRRKQTTSSLTWLSNDAWVPPRPPVETPVSSSNVDTNVCLDNVGFYKKVSLTLTDLQINNVVLYNAICHPYASLIMRMARHGVWEMGYSKVRSYQPIRKGYKRSSVREIIRIQSIMWTVESSRTFIFSLCSKCIFQR